MLGLTRFLCHDNIGARQSTINSKSIQMIVKFPLLSGLLLCNLLISNHVVGQSAEQCIDTDGDGYGWNGVATCSPQDRPQVSTLTDIKDASISSDGRFVAYETTITSPKVTEPDKVWLHDRNTNATTPLNTDAAGTEIVTLGAVLSGDGRYVAYIGGTNSNSQGIYVYDINSEKTTELVAPNPGQSIIRSLEISDDGSYVAYQDVGFPEGDTLYVINRLTGESIVASVNQSGDSLDLNAGQGITMQALSGNGRYLFTRKFINGQDASGRPTSTNFVFVFDIQMGTATRILEFTGEILNLTSSADGRTVAFYSGDNTLVPNDTSGVFSPSFGTNISSEDVFVYELDTGAISRVSVDSDGNQSTDGANFSTQISADGRYVSFVSYTNLDPNAEDCEFINCDYIHDRETRTTVRLNNLSGLNISKNGTVVQYDANSQDIYSYTIPGVVQCIDLDGDGYGWNGEETCTPKPTNPVVNPNCDYSYADLQGGWGWNATEQQSCKPVGIIITPPVPTECVDSDGDGFGWNSITTCDPSSS